MRDDLVSKLSQVIEQIPKDVLYDFLCSYAQEHEELATALVSEFWQAEKDDYHSMVQQCLMHPSPVGVKNGDGRAGPKNKVMKDEVIKAKNQEMPANTDLFSHR